MKGLFMVNNNEKGETTSKKNAKWYDSPLIEIYAIY